MANSVPEKAHAALGASSSHRWINCPGSISIIESLPPGTGQASVHAAEGSAAHALGELCLKRDQDPSVYLDTVVEGFTVDEEMVEGVRMYVNKCRDTLKGVGGGAVSYIEKQLNLNKLNPPRQMFGTGDFIAYNDVEFILDVVDLKYGRGVLVEVKDNPQLMYYGLGALLALEDEVPGVRVDKIRITIVQPRVDHPDGLIRTVEYSYEDLLAFTADLLEAARATVQPDAPRHPGEWCRWCPASAVCPEKTAESLEIARMEFDTPLEPPAPESLSPEELEWVLERLPLIEEWARSVRQYATEALEAGAKVPGFKLVAKRAYRKWVDEAAVEEWVEEMGVPPEVSHETRLRSPAQLEKKLGKKTIPDDLINKSSSGVTLVPESDKRPAVTKGEEFLALPNPDSQEEKS